MKITFGGHNFWIIEDGNKTLYFDPVLVDGFGIKADGGRIFPPRLLDIDAVPPADYILITHEHTDHFHIPSLLLIPKNCVVIIGVLMPSFIVDVLGELGFKNVKRSSLSQFFEVGPFKIKLYNSAKHTAFWEQRVTQILLYFQNSGSDDSIFFSVDAAMSTYFIDDIRKGRVKVPKSIVLSNNSETPFELFDLGSLDDFRPEKVKKDRAVSNLRILKDLFVDYITQIPEVRFVFVVGGGFVKESYSFSFQEIERQKVFERAANSLSMTINVYSPFPGDCFTDTSEGYILNRCSFISLKQVIENKPASKMTSQDSMVPENVSNDLLNLEQENDALKQLMDYLPEFAQSLMLSKQGRHVVFINEYQGKILAQQRIVFVFILKYNEQRLHQLALDLQSGSFIEVKLELNQLAKTYPYGLIIHLSDWHAVLNGHLQIWDIASGMRSWYPGDNAFMSLVAFLYLHFGEQTNPGLAYKALSQTYNNN